MKNYSFRFEKLIFALTLATALLAASCGGKKNPLPPPPPTPPPAASNAGGAPAPGRPVVAEFTIEPSTIERGQSAVMRWTVTGSSNVSINNGIGTVAPSGTRRMTPDATTTYTLTATGPLGDTMATATVTVTGPAPPPPPSRNTNNGNRGTLESRVQSDLRDVLYDYDSNNVSDAARTALQADADALKRIFADFPNASVNVEGHCDERGSAEYNLGLGDRRASSARDFLVQQGIPADKLKTISYGKERPVCTESDESCWQRNRRAHFSVGQ
ncbi:MAG TPA: OmpA family protein [Bryobacteraceae bacterium]|nr:OmpA family protein [Bryobacteraceae bacterium]